jgi:hypothetical protein
MPRRQWVRRVLCITIASALCALMPASPAGAYYWDEGQLEVESFFGDIRCFFEVHNTYFPEDGGETFISKIRDMSCWLLDASPPATTSTVVFLHAFRLQDGNNYFTTYPQVINSPYNATEYELNLGEPWIDAPMDTLVAICLGTVPPSACTYPMVLH